MTHVHFIQKIANHQSLLLANISFIRHILFGLCSMVTRLGMCILRCSVNLVQLVFAFKLKCYDISSKLQYRLPPHNVKMVSKHFQL